MKVIMTSSDVTMVEKIISQVVSESETENVEIIPGALWYMPAFGLTALPPPEPDESE